MPPLGCADVRQRCLWSSTTRWPVAKPPDTITSVTEAPAAGTSECIFCAIAARKAEASHVNPQGAVARELQPNRSEDLAAVQVNQV